MKLTEFLHYKKPLKKFTNYRDFPIFKEILPATLADQVSNKGERRKVAPCLQEMTLMLTCLQTTDFNQSQCAKEIASFVKCGEMHMEKAKHKEEAESKGIVAGATKLRPKHLNQLLRKYPQPK